ncbi:3-dehydroquinate dehydratase (3-dehydroquinase) [Rhizopus azygosporus]|uniref:3-dehydroquinate dehydratase (3-dehydroquinase) n=1 Tax=Rhizopus azygosporus TaxID=86630 RepID=A0A367KAF5_RHIAZ|nr:3-dehydroquinate dehydratase (3-dehydroquinase) [Rhizopus azygosporus]
MVYGGNNIETIPVLDNPKAIHIGYNLIDYIASTLTTHVPVSTYCIVTDTNLAPLYLPQLMSAFRAHMNQNQRLLTRVLPPGEMTKSRQGKASIEDFMLNQSCTRDTCLMALGGGVVGDLVGFIAATFMRGIPFVQIPTTLLAMVDSSIGGKTAIDTPHGKNLIGSFWQPKFIFMDLEMLKSLPPRELANGMAEVIKTAAISSEAEFVKLEKGKQIIESVILGTNQNSEDKMYVASVISASARFKADVVTKDERETGLRGLLNFGHTIGHAIEAVLAPSWLHGECVSVGLVMEAELSCCLGHCDPSVVDRIKVCLDLYGLPTLLNEKAKSMLTIDRIMTAMKVDKKNKGSQKRIVLLSAIGQPLEPKASDVSDEPIITILRSHVLPSSGQSDIKEDEESNQPTLSSSFTLTFHSDVAPSHLLFNLLESRYQCNIVKRNDQVYDCKPEANTENKSTSIFITHTPGTTCNNTMAYEYVLLGDLGKEESCKGLIAFIHMVTQEKTNTRHVCRKDKLTTFITPTISDYSTLLSDVMNQWLEGADAIEFRVDLILTHERFRADPKNWVNITGTQLAYLRRMTKLPVIFTVRTEPQAGAFDPKLSQEYMELVTWGHRWGCDYVDVEFTMLPKDTLNELMSLNSRFSPVSKIIASFHDPQHTIRWSLPEMMHVYKRAEELFEAHNHPGVIKLVGLAQDHMDNIELEQFRHFVDPEGNKEIILINMGPKGKYSRVANQFLTPTTHPALPSAAAPGQLSIEEIKSIRQQLAME